MRGIPTWIAFLGVVLALAGWTTASKSVEVQIECKGCSCDFSFSGALSPAMGLELEISTNFLFPVGRFISNLTAWGGDGQRISLTPSSPGVYVIAAADAQQLAELRYSIDVMQQQSRLGMRLTCNHCDEAQSHVFLSGYASFLWFHGLEEVPYHVSVVLPTNWTAVSDLQSLPGHVSRKPLHQKGGDQQPAVAKFLAPALFNLLDSPILLTRTELLYVVQIPAPQAPGDRKTGAGDVKNTQLLVWDATPISDLVAARLKRATSITMLALQRLGFNLHTRQHSLATQGVVPRGLATDPLPYTIYFELYAAGADYRFLNWALAHPDAFQGSDEAKHFSNFYDVGLTYHFIHHMYHSYFVPERVYTDNFLPLKTAWKIGRRSGFMWFAEGFPQYAAYSGLALTKSFSLSDVLTSFCWRFAATILRTPPTNMSLVEISLTQSPGSDLWGYSFSAGAMVAMMVDYQLRARNCTLGLHESMILLRNWIEAHEGVGVPEDSFEAVFQNVTGLSVSKIFATYVRGAQRVPVADLLGLAGIKVITGQSEPQFKVLAENECTADQLRFRGCAFGSQ
eukprot:RCo047134